MTLSRRAAVYRFFDADGALLYVGCSYNPFQRWALHLSTKVWIDQVAEMRVEWHDTHREAARAEAVAIRDEGPLHNRQTPVQPLLVPVVVGEGPALLREWLHVHDGRACWEFRHMTGATDRIVMMLRNGRRPPSPTLARAIEIATDGAVPATSWATSRGSLAQPVDAPTPERVLRSYEAYLRRKGYAEDDIAQLLGSTRDQLAKRIAA